jgi:TolB-like protein
LPDIFLSYSRDDQATARRFAEGFEREGFTIWWDASLNPGEAYDQVTEKALREAKAVVVLWSRKSVDSRWVRAEATQAHDNRTMVPVMIEPCKRPIMFELTHTADLSHWTGDISDKAWQSYVAGVRRFVEKDVSGLDRPADNSRSLAVARSIKGAADSRTERLPSIAVLPFSNMSGDKEQEYFSDGLAEEIINALAQISGLKVIARTSAFAFKGQNTDIRRIAETLGVTNILEGSVRRSGNRIRVTAQLITASDGTHLWSERYDRELADVFVVQDEISSAISEALKVKLSPQAAAGARHTPTLPAYEALLKARHFHWKVTAESTDQARLFYEQAIALDPQFALAHALYADFLFGCTTIVSSPLREVAPLIRTLAQRALELDPYLADAHVPLCLLAAAHDYDWQEAGRQFLLATPGGRASPVSHMACGFIYLLGAGLRTDAVVQLELAVKGDPLHLLNRDDKAYCLGAVGRYADAMDLLQHTRDLDSGFFWTYYMLADLHAARESFPEALSFAETAFSLAPWHSLSVGVYAGLLVRMGQSDRGNQVLQALRQDGKYDAAMGMAIFHSHCGNIDLAADWFEKAIAERYSLVATFLQGTTGKAVRASARWPRLAALMNLPVAANTLAT